MISLVEMNYLDLEKFFQILLCIITVLLGICLSLLCILYDENIKSDQAVNVFGEVEYIFPNYRLFNISD